MAHVTIEVEEYTCDGCGSQTLADTGVDGLPPGFHGNVIRISNGGGDGGDWYACSRKCIVKAVERAGLEDRTP